MAFISNLFFRGRLAALGALFGLTASLPGQQDWQVLDPFLSDLSLNGMVYFRGQFVGVGRNGTVLLAKDNIVADWQVLSSGTADWLCALAASGERMVAGRYNAGVPFMHSTDGRAWQPGTLSHPDGSPASALCSRQISSMANRFLAIGESAGQVATSENGIDFILQPQVGAGYPGGGNSICATGRKFFVALPGLTLLSTVDGRNWTSQSFREYGGDYPSSEKMSLASDGDQALVISAYGFLARSTDGGDTFTIRRASEVGSSYAGLGLTALTHAAGAWVGFRGEPNATSLSRSSDGLNWTKEPILIDLFTPIQQIAAHPAGYFWAVNGFSGTTIPPLVPSRSVVYAGTRRPQPTNAELPARLVNLSTRLRTGTGDNVLIAGFALRNGTKNIILRGLGPSLAAAGVTAVLADPTVTVVDQRGRELAQMRDWEEDLYQQRALTALNLRPGSAAEAAGLFSLGSGNYTAVLRGQDGAEGNCLLEVYDVETGAASALENLSTRGPVGTEDRVLISGFVISGVGQCRVAIRALGPSLTAFGVPNVLADPKIDIYSGSNLLLSNDDWSSGEPAELAQAKLTPSDARESARVVSLPAGSYTVIVRGKGDTVGNAIVEVYALD